MRIEERRFRSILDGTATELSGKEILIRHVAYEAERQGDNPRLAVERSLPFVVFIDDMKGLGNLDREREAVASKRIGVPERTNTASVRSDSRHYNEAETATNLFGASEPPIEKKKSGWRPLTFEAEGRPTLFGSLLLGAMISFVGGGVVVVLIPMALLGLGGPVAAGLGAIISVLFYALLISRRK